MINSGACSVAITIKQYVPWSVMIRRKMGIWVRTEEREKKNKKKDIREKKNQRPSELLSIRVIAHQKTAPLIRHYLPFPCIYLFLFFLIFFLFFIDSIFANQNYSIVLMSVYHFISVDRWISNSLKKIIFFSYFSLLIKNHLLSHN